MIAGRGAIPGHGGASRDLILGLGGLHLSSVSIDSQLWRMLAYFLGSIRMESSVDPEARANVALVFAYIYT